MSLVHLLGSPAPTTPTLIAAFDGWVDAGGAATSAAEHLAHGAEPIATFENDRLFDYRARRPTLEIVDGRLAELEWPEIGIARRRVGDRDLLVLTGPEPDFHWRQLADDLVEVARSLGVVEWISLGAIPAAVPHTRPVPILGTASRPGLLRGDVTAGPAGLLRVPAAAISTIDFTISAAGISAIGYFAQIPHYVSGGYPSAAIELIRSVERHLGQPQAVDELADAARQLRTQLDTATALDEKTRAYVERLESMVDEARLPAGDDLISEIERFLREGGSPGSQQPGDR